MLIPAPDNISKEAFPFNISFKGDRMSINVGFLELIHSTRRTGRTQCQRVKTLFFHNSCVQKEEAIFPAMEISSKQQQQQRSGVGDCGGFFSYSLSRSN